MLQIIIKLKATVFYINVCCFDLRSMTYSNSYITYGSHLTDDLCCRVDNTISYQPHVEPWHLGWYLQGPLSEWE